ncbi:ATP-binding protein [Chloroflexota bacterium]
MGKAEWLPNAENTKKILDRWNEVKERIDKLVEKKIDPIYFEWAGKITPWLKESKYAPWMLDRVTNSNVDMAKVAVALPDPHRDPSWGREHLEVTEQLAKDLGLDRETADKYLHEMMEKELVNPTRNGYQRQRGSQLLHLIHSHPKYPDSVLADMVLCYTRFEMQKHRNERLDWIKESGGRPPSGMGPIRPRWKSIQNVPGVLPAEDWREVMKAKKTWAVLPCICRLDDRGSDSELPVERCMQADKSAEYGLARGAARELTLKEAFDLYEELGKYPLLNMSGLGKDAVKAGPECICAWDSCLAMTHYYLPGSKYKISDFIIKNRFRATVDPEKCIGCRVCADERCQFGASQMKYYPEFDEERAYVDEDKCMGCGLCVETCPVGCKGMKIVEPPEYILDLPEEGGAMGIDVEQLMAATEREKAEIEAKKEK